MNPSSLPRCTAKSGPSNRAVSSRNLCDSPEFDRLLAALLQRAPRLPRVQSPSLLVSPVKAPSLLSKLAHKPSPAESLIRLSPPLSPCGQVFDELDQREPVFKCKRPLFVSQHLKQFCKRLSVVLHRAVHCAPETPIVVFDHHGDPRNGGTSRLDYAPALACHKIALTPSALIPSVAPLTASA